MAITAQITKQLEPGFVQADIKYKNGYTKYYKVPEKNAKYFITQKIEQEKDFDLYSNILFFTAVFAGFVGGAYFARKMDKLKQFAVESLSAIGCGTLSTLGFLDYRQNQEKKFDKAYTAKEIFYKA